MSPLIVAAAAAAATAPTAATAAWTVPVLAAAAAAAARTAETGRAHETDKRPIIHVFGRGETLGAPSGSAAPSRTRGETPP